MTDIFWDDNSRISWDELKKQRINGKTLEELAKNNTILTKNDLDAFFQLLGFDSSMDETQQATLSLNSDNIGQLIFSWNTNDVEKNESIVLNWDKQEDKAKIIPVGNGSPYIKIVYDFPSNSYKNILGYANISGNSVVTSYGGVNYGSLTAIYYAKKDTTTYLPLSKTTNVNIHPSEYDLFVLSTVSVWNINNMHLLMTLRCTVTQDISTVKLSNDTYSHIKFRKNQSNSDSQYIYTTDDFLYTNQPIVLGDIVLGYNLKMKFQKQEVFSKNIGLHFVDNYSRPKKIGSTNIHDVYEVCLFNNIPGKVGKVGYKVEDKIFAVWITATNYEDAYNFDQAWNFGEIESTNIDWQSLVINEPILLDCFDSIPTINYHSNELQIQNTQTYWVPNHFTPVLLKRTPFSSSWSKSLGSTTWHDNDSPFYIYEPWFYEATQLASNIYPYYDGVTYSPHRQIRIREPNYGEGAYVRENPIIVSWTEYMALRQSHELGWHYRGAYLGIYLNNWVACSQWVDVIGATAAAQEAATYLTNNPPAVYGYSFNAQSKIYSWEIHTNDTESNISWIPLSSDAQYSFVKFITHENSDYVSLTQGFSNTLIPISSNEASNFPPGQLTPKEEYGVVAAINIRCAADQKYSPDSIFTGLNWSGWGASWSEGDAIVNPSISYPTLDFSDVKKDDCIYISTAVEQQSSQTKLNSGCYFQNDVWGAAVLSVTFPGGVVSPNGYTDNASTYISLSGDTINKITLGTTPCYYSKHISTSITTMLDREEKCSVNVYGGAYWKITSTPLKCWVVLVPSTNLLS